MIAIYGLDEFPKYVADNITAAAKWLNVSRSCIYRALKKREPIRKMYYVFKIY